MGKKYPFLEEAPGGVWIKLRIQPRASRDEVAGIHGDSLKVKLTAPPVEGEANKALVSFLSKLLGIKKSSIKIASGEKSRTKRILVEGASVEQIEGMISERLG
ncbi:MAG TPA: DUF167 domain-containing protein [Thermodesulfobacteriota bacterium]|nr:DUF167 domain-containing protein [Thermodesulfobacteriota bacterium]